MFQFKYLNQILSSLSKFRMNQIQMKDLNTPLPSNQQYFHVDMPETLITQIDSEVIQEEKEISFVGLIVPDFKIKSFTFILILTQILFFFVPWIYSDLKKESWPNVLITLGADSPNSVSTNHEIYRLFMPILLHYNFEGLLLSVVSETLILFHLEASFPKLTVIAVYFCSNLGGIIFANMLFPFGYGVSASLAIAGCFAFEMINLINDKQKFMVENPWKFLICCFCLGIVSLPILRVMDNDSKIKTDKPLKIMIFVFTIIAFYIVIIFQEVHTKKLGIIPFDFPIYSHLSKKNRSFFFLKIIFFSCIFDRSLVNISLHEKRK